MLFIFIARGLEPKAATSGEKEVWLLIETPSTFKVPPVCISRARTGRASGGGVDESVRSAISLKVGGGAVFASGASGSSVRANEFICAAIMLRGFVISKPRITS